MSPCQGPSASLWYLSLEPWQCSVLNQTLPQFQQATIVSHQELGAVHPEGRVHLSPEPTACSDWECSAKIPGSPGLVLTLEPTQDRWKDSGRAEKRWFVSACMVTYTLF